MAEIEVEIVGAEGKLWSGSAWQVSAKAGEGEIGILAGHEPVLAVLAPGEVRVTTPEGPVIRASAQDGFISMQNNTLTIVAGTAELV